MQDLPIAKCIKEIYAQHNKTFTDSERATIFWNSDMNITEKLTALREIHDTTTDGKLKAQIQARLDCEEGIQQVFMSRDSEYVHLVYLDDSDNADRVFASIDAAITYGKEECNETFHIEKEILDDRVKPNADPNTILGGYADFKKDGTVISCHCYSSRGYEGVLLNDVEPEGFEEAYIPVLNPFEYGDIVRIIGDTRPAIVFTSQQHWNERTERIKKSKLPLNYYTNTLTVEFLYPDGEFGHGHPDILALEKLEEWDNEKEWNLLKSVSDLMKGNGRISEVLNDYNHNKR